MSINTIPVQVWNQLPDHLRGLFYSYCVEILLRRLLQDIPDSLLCDILPMFFVDRTPTAINPNDVNGNWNLNAIDINWAILPCQYWHE